jgi:hypothetical protein
MKIADFLTPADGKADVALTDKKKMLAEDSASHGRAASRARQYGHVSHIDIRLSGGHIGAKSNTLPPAFKRPILGAHC